MGVGRSTLAVRSRPATALELGAALTELHNHIYANDGLSAGEAFAEVTKLLFMKVLDDRKGAAGKARGFSISPAELAATTRGDATGAAPFVARLEELFDAATRDHAEVFRRDERLHLKAATLAHCVSRLAPFDLLDASFDAKGVAFQRMVSSAWRGERGQFFTPEPVVRLMVEMLEPRAGELVLDPACGTGGFLVETLRFLRRSGGDSARTILGLEINPGVARVARMQVELFGGDPSGIRCVDALAEPDRHSALEGEVDLLLTNPPFGTQGRITAQSLLERYEVGHRWAPGNGDGGFARTDRVLAGQAPDLLFVERCLQLLKSGGRMGIVLPSSDLESSSLAWFRAFVRTQAELLASVALPQETFAPFGTGVKAALLFLRKRARAATPAAPVFFGLVRRIGYAGGKHATRTVQRDATGTILLGDDRSELLDEDVSDVARAYAAFTGGTPPTLENCFTCAAAEVTDRLDANFHLPEHRRLLDTLRDAGAVPLRHVVEVVTARAEVLKDPAATLRYVELSDVNVLGSEIVQAKPLKVFEAPSRATYAIRTGDVLIGVAGNATGTERHPVAYVTAAYDGAVCSNGFRVLRAREGVIDPFFLVVFLRSPLFRQQMFRLRTGSAIPAVSERDLLELLVPLPAPEEQRRLAAACRKSIELRTEATRMLDACSEALATVSGARGRRARRSRGAKG